jgi:hypothetical protein
MYAPIHRVVRTGAARQIIWAFARIAGMRMLLYMSPGAEELPRGSRSRWHASFLRFAEYVDETEVLVHLHMTGVSRIVDWPNFLVKAFRLPETDESLIQARQEAKQAMPEYEKGFPLVHAHALLGIWSALEAMVEDAVVAWIAEKPDTLQSPDFAKIRIPLAEFSLMDADDQALYLVTEVQRDVKLTQGITRFERLLHAVGLGGSVDEDVRKAIYEAQQVRNSLAHRGGFADRRLAEACPWLELNPGQRLTVSRWRFQYYAQAMKMYCLEVLNRCYVHDGIDVITADFAPLSSFLQHESRPHHAVDASEGADQAS